MPRNIQLIINSSELGAGTRGASLGPLAIQVAARKKGSKFFSSYRPISIIQKNELLDEQSKFAFAKGIDGIQEVASDVIGKVSQTLTSNQFPLILSGDHSSGAFTIAGIRKKFPTQKIGVVWIDAHGDLHSPYTTPSGNMHGMPLAIALGIDNLEMQRNNPDNETVQYWEGLKTSSDVCPSINPQNLVFIGVRDTEKEEDFLIEKYGIRNILVDEVRKHGVEKTLLEVQNKLADCELIYVSFDVDSMDPDLTSYGTGTPVKNGLTIEEARALLIGFASSPKTICMEIVEVNPCLDDKKNRMAEIAFDLLESVANSLENK